MRGYVERHSFFESIDVLILPSKREGFGSVVVEANACSIPVIGSDIYGLTDSLKHGTNGLVASNYSDYIKHLKTLSIACNYRNIREAHSSPPFAFLSIT